MFSTRHVGLAKRYEVELLRFNISTIQQLVKVTVAKILIYPIFFLSLQANH